MEIFNIDLFLQVDYLKLHIEFGMVGLEPVQNRPNPLHLQFQNQVNSGGSHNALLLEAFANIFSFPHCGLDKPKQVQTDIHTDGFEVEDELDEKRYFSPLGHHPPRKHVPSILHPTLVLESNR